MRKRRRHGRRLAKVDELLTKKKENSSANYYPPTLSSAIKMDDQLNLAIISVPGKYAAGVADECLDHDINVMLFSDNVTIEEEKRLKEKAVSKELLMMGPDCGTAIINNVPLAFANVIRPGDIGIGRRLRHRHPGALLADRPVRRRASRRSSAPAAATSRSRSAVS